MKSQIKRKAYSINAKTSYNAKTNDYWTLDLLNITNTCQIITNRTATLLYDKLAMIKNFLFTSQEINQIPQRVCQPALIYFRGF